MELSGQPMPGGVAGRFRLVVNLGAVTWVVRVCALLAPSAWFPKAAPTLRLAPLCPLRGFHDLLLGDAYEAPQLLRCDVHVSSRVEVRQQ